MLRAGFSVCLFLDWCGHVAARARSVTEEYGEEIGERAHTFNVLAQKFHTLVTQPVTLNNVIDMCSVGPAGEMNSNQQTLLPTSVGHVLNCLPHAFVHERCVRRHLNVFALINNVKYVCKK